MADIAQPADAAGKTTAPMTAGTVAYRFGPFRLDPRAASLQRGDEAIALRRKSFDVLLHLVRNRDRVVSKDELMGTVWADVVVTDNSLAQCVKEIRDALGDEAQEIVATSARRGYVFRADVTEIAADPPPAARASANRPRRAGIFAATLAILGLSAAVLYVELDRGTPAPAASERLSLAVLPFRGPAADDYFSSGIATDIAAALGRFPELAVASPDIVAHRAGAGATPRDATTPDVRYLVEGTVLRSPTMIRISVRLTDVPRARLLWSQTYDAPAAQVLAIQDAITSRIAGALAVKVANVEEKRSASKSAGTLEAYDFVLRGRERLAHLNRTAHSEARMDFERAIALDPTSAAPYIGLGRVDLSAAAMGWTEDAEQAFRHAEDAALRAIALDEFDPEAHALLGRAYARTGQYDRAVETLKRAVKLNPSAPESYAALGDALLWSGDPAAAADALETSLAMDPGRSAEDLFSLGTAYLLTGKNADAARTLERATQRNEGNPYIYAALAAAYAASGRPAESRAAAAEVRRRNPFFDADEFGSLLRDRAQREALARALKSAGL